MADNVSITAGSGTTIASDDISGVQYQRVKVCHGADGSATDVSSASPLPISSADLGAQADSAASSDTGTFSLVSLFKRLLTKIPALGQGLMSASLPVVLASDQSNVPFIPKPLSTTGNITALNGTVALTVDGMSGVAIDLRGTFTATITFQGTIDGTNWSNLISVAATGGGSFSTASTVSAAGTYMIPCGGLKQIRANATAYTSGTVNIAINAVANPSLVYNLPYNTGALVAGTNAIGDVGFQYRTTATGAAATAAVMSPATPAATAAKAGAGRIVGIILTNTSAAVRSVKFWNTAVGGVTLGTTAAVFELDIPAGGMIDVELSGGIAFSTAITYAVTGGKGLTDNTAISANDVTGAMFYA